MTLQPGAQNAAAAGRGRLRASHADREHVIVMLKIAFVQGRLTKDELDVRLGQTFAARTYADLATLTADIPAGLAEAQSPREPARSSAWNAAKFAAFAAIGPGLVALAAAAGNEQLGRWLMPFAFVFMMTSIVAGAVMLDAWQQKRSGRGLPPGPAQRGHTLDGKQDGSTGDDLIRYEASNGARAPRTPDPAVTRHTTRTRRRPHLPADLQITV